MNSSRFRLVCLLLCCAAPSHVDNYEGHYYKLDHVNAHSLPRTHVPRNVYMHSVGFYYFWVKVAYPWISKPDEVAETDEMRLAREKAGKKAGRGKYSKAR